VIFDRTQNDVDTAIILRATKVQNFEELTEAEMLTLEKGTLTINTLNRIEQKQAELKDLFNLMIYFAKDFESKEWTVEQFFKQADFDRILQNNRLLKDAFFVYKTTPQNEGTNFLKFETINNVEEVLHHLDMMISDIKNNYRFSGETVCGGNN
jgi:hypothetical protein